MCYHLRCAAGCRCDSLSVSGNIWLSLPTTLDTNDLLICCRNEIYQSKHPKARHWTSENDNICTRFTQAHWVGERFNPHVRSLIFWFFTPFWWHQFIYYSGELSLKYKNRRWNWSHRSLFISILVDVRASLSAYILLISINKIARMKHLINNCGYANQFPHHILQTYLCQCHWSITFWSDNKMWSWIPFVHVWMREKHTRNTCYT